MQHSIRNVIQMNNISFVIIYIIYKNIFHLNIISKPSSIGSENLKKEHVKEIIPIKVSTGDTQKELMLHGFVCNISLIVHLRNHCTNKGCQSIYGSHTLL